MDSVNAFATFNVLTQEGRVAAAACLPVDDYEKQLEAIQNASVAKPPSEKWPACLCNLLAGLWVCDIVIRQPSSMSDMRIDGGGYSSAAVSSCVSLRVVSSFWLAAIWGKDS